MSVVEIKPVKGSKKKRIRKGRGNASGFGGECGRGHKGQKSRSGFKSKPGFEGGQMPLYRRIPKKRGMRNPFRIEYLPINLGTINEVYKDNEVADIDSLIKLGIVKKNRQVKILASGEITKQITLKFAKYSTSAIKKLDEAKTKYEIVKA